MNNIYLQGSETVHQASHNIQAAAESMAQTARYMDEIMSRFSRDMNEILLRLEALKG